MPPSRNSRDCASQKTSSKAQLTPFGKCRLCIHIFEKLEAVKSKCRCGRNYLLWITLSNPLGWGTPPLVCSFRGRRAIYKQAIPNPVLILLIRPWLLRQFTRNFWPRIRARAFTTEGASAKCSTKPAVCIRFNRKACKVREKQLKAWITLVAFAPAYWWGIEGYLDVCLT